MTKRVAVLRAILGRGLLGRVEAMGATLRGALEARFGQHPHVGDIRGRGLFLGLELVTDRGTKVAFDPARRVAARVKAAAFEAGLICYPMAGTVDGRLGDHVLLAPPFIIGESEVAELVEKLGGAVEAALA